MGEEYRGAVKMKSAEEILVEAFNTDRKRGSFRRGCHHCSMYGGGPQPTEQHENINMCSYVQAFSLLRYVETVLNRIIRRCHYQSLHMSCISKPNSSTCAQCKVTEEADHLLGHCPRYQEARNLFEIVGLIVGSLRTFECTRTLAESSSQPESYPDFLMFEL